MASGRIWTSDGWIPKAIQGLKKVGSKIKYELAGGEYGRRQNERLKQTQWGRDFLKRYYNK